MMLNVWARVCPCCGYDVATLTHKSDECPGWQVICDQSRGGCHAKGREAGTPGEAIDRWNRWPLFRLCGDCGRTDGGHYLHCPGDPAPERISA